MPANVVKTAEQERLWNKAKKLAEKQGHAKDYPYIMGIFKQMGAMNKAYMPGLERPGQGPLWETAKRRARTAGRERDYEYVLELYRQMSGWKSMEKSYLNPSQTLAHARVPGQLPNRETIEAMRLAKEKPQPFSVARLLAQDEPRLTTSSIVRDLGLSIAEQSDWTKFLDKAVLGATNELTLRQDIMSKCLNERLGGGLRKAILQRSLTYWRGYRKSMVQIMSTDDLRKAETRGGKYHRRVPREKGGYTYYYDEDKYRNSKQAHTSGEEGTESYIFGKVQKAIEATGKAGCGPEAFKDLVKKYGAKAVAGVLRKNTGGKLQFQKNRFKMIQAKEEPKKQGTGKLFDKESLREAAKRAKGKSTEKKLAKSDLFLFIPDSEDLSKAGPHKYVSKKRVGGRWVYEYPEDRKKTIVDAILDFLSTGKRNLTVGQVARSFKVDKGTASTILKDLAAKGKISESGGEYRKTVKEPKLVIPKETTGEQLSLFSPPGATDEQKTTEEKAGDATGQKEDELDLDIDHEAIQARIREAEDKARPEFELGEEEYKEKVKGLIAKMSDDIYHVKPVSNKIPMFEAFQVREDETGRYLEYGEGIRVPLNLSDADRPQDVASVVRGKIRDINRTSDREMFGPISFHGKAAERLGIPEGVPEEPAFEKPEEGVIVAGGKRTGTAKEFNYAYSQANPAETRRFFGKRYTSIIYKDRGEVVAEKHETLSRGKVVDTTYMVNPAYLPKEEPVAEPEAYTQAEYETIMEGLAEKAGLPVEFETMGHKPGGGAIGSREFHVNTGPAGLKRGYKKPLDVDKVAALITEASEMVAAKEGVPVDEVKEDIVSATERRDLGLHASFALVATALSEIRSAFRSQKAGDQIGNIKGLELLGKYFGKEKEDPRFEPDPVPERSDYRDKEKSEKELGIKPQQAIMDPGDFDSDKSYTVWERSGDNWLIDRTYGGAYLKGTMDLEDLHDYTVAVMPSGVDPNESVAKEQKEEPKLVIPKDEPKETTTAELAEGKEPVKPGLDPRVDGVAYSANEILMGKAPYAEGDALSVDHDSMENAYIIDDYPYGRSRTEMRIWVETNKNGQRVARQTKNPKTGRWNKSKKSTYSPAMALYVDDKGHIQSASLGYGAGSEGYNKFKEKYPDTMEKLPKEHRISIESGITYGELVDQGMSHAEAMDEVNRQHLETLKEEGVFEEKKAEREAKEKAKKEKKKAKPTEPPPLIEARHKEKGLLSVADVVKMETPMDVKAHLSKHGLTGYFKEKDVSNVYKGLAKKARELNHHALATQYGHIAKVMNGLGGAINPGARADKALAHLKKHVKKHGTVGE